MSTQTTDSAPAPPPVLRGGEHVVQSLDRALDILEALATAREGIGVTELAQSVGLHKSTVHRLLATLANRDYVEKTTEGRYRLGLKPIEIVSAHINSLELQTEARPYVAQITRELGLTSHLGVLEGDKVVYIERMDLYATVKLYSQIGIRVPAYCSSLGKCLLSNYSREDLQRILADCPFNRFTANTIDNFEDFYAEMKRVRQRGWAMDNREFDLNNRCIGAPIYDYRGEIIAAISASSTPAVLTEERIEEVAAVVMQMAAAISHNLGYIG